MTDKAICRGCKKEIVGNPKFVLKVMTMCGYEDLDFHDRKCFLTYAKKKFKLMEI